MLPPRPVALSIRGRGTLLRSDLPRNGRRSLPRRPQYRDDPLGNVEFLPRPLPNAASANVGDAELSFFPRVTLLPAIILSEEHTA